MKTSLLLLFALTVVVLAQTSEQKAAPADSPATVQPGFDSIHGNYVTWFVESRGFGLSRMPQVMSRPPAEWIAGEDKYLVKSVNLIGILKHKEPVVYLNFVAHANMPEMKDQNPAQERKLNEFETAALKQFADKKINVVNDSNTRIMGAIRAQASCTKCHDDVQEGDLMGAFTYVLEKQAPPPKQEVMK